MSWRLSALVVALLASKSVGGEANWKCGIAKADITPSQPMWMAGYASRNRPSEGAVHPLWLKVAVLEDANGNRCAIVTADLLGFSQAMHRDICAKAKAKLSLEPRQILLAASHTHAGPVVGSETMYPMDEQRKALLEPYADSVVERTVELIEKASFRMRDVALTWSLGECNFAFNRRNNPERDVAKLRASNALMGPTDHRVYVVEAKTLDGSPLFTLAGYACHNTTLGGDYFKFSGDYAGFFQAELERAMPGVQAMFVAGCGADQNPGPRGSQQLAERYGRQLADATLKAAGSRRHVIIPRLRTAYESIDLRYGSQPAAEELQKIAATRNDYFGRWAKYWLAELRAGRALPKTYQYPVQAWRLGDLLWINLGGEVVVDYAIRMRNEFGSNAWTIAYANDVMAYIPSLRVWKEGGYEGATAMYAWGRPAHQWADDVEEMVVQSIRRTVAKLDSP